MTVREAKAIDLVAYLARLGFAPQRVRGHQYWYHSPFRDERTPSFKINRRLNRWYDFGPVDGIHKGNLVDFGIAFHRCTVSELLARLSGGLSPGQQTVLPRKDEQQIGVVAEGPLKKQPLLDYLHSRGISAAVAKAWCREVSYTIKGGTYYAIGFKNNSGGYELRNAQYKLSSSPKDFTLLGAPQGATLHVFEGFTDFLSYLSLPGSRAKEAASYLILNSASFFEKARPIMAGFSTVKLYLDQDDTGRRLTQQALALGPACRDESHLFAGHKDLNDYLVSRKQELTKTLKATIS